MQPGKELAGILATCSQIDLAQELGTCNWGLIWHTWWVHAAGTNQQEEVEPAKRVGVLWDYYRRLVADGWEPDVFSYTTSFRCGGSGFRVPMTRLRQSCGSRRSA